jgi:hypothetical protein
MTTTTLPKKVKKVSRYVAFAVEKHAAFGPVRLCTLIAALLSIVCLGWMDAITPLSLFSEMLLRSALFCSLFVVWTSYLQFAESLGYSDLRLFLTAKIRFQQIDLRLLVWLIVGLWIVILCMTVCWWEVMLMEFYCSLFLSLFLFTFFFNTE